MRFGLLMTMKPKSDWQVQWGKNVTLISQVMWHLTFLRLFLLWFDSKAEAFGCITQFFLITNISTSKEVECFWLKISFVECKFLYQVDGICKSVGSQCWWQTKNWILLIFFDATKTEEFLVNLELLLQFLFAVSINVVVVQ